MPSVHPRPLARSARAGSAGFTLVELMTVVAIMGVLGAIGIAMVRGHINAAKANRALAGVQMLRVREEQFRAENGRYLTCSPGSPALWYPMATPDRTAYEWHRTDHANYDLWRALGLPRGETTQYGFIVNAGLPGAAYPTLLTVDQPTPPVRPDPWFVIQFLGNVDADSVYMRGFATSINGEVYVENDGE